MQQIESSITALAEAYAAYLATNDEALESALFEVMDLCMDGPWDKLWRLVQALATLPEEPAPTVLAAMAAGPLEDLLAKAGPEYIAVVEAFARSTPRAARMLTGVWQSSIQSDVWQRVVRFCRKVPDPIDGTYAY
jgi:hypothetical protein